MTDQQSSPSPQERYLAATEPEYFEAVADGMEREAALYENELRERFGHDGITLR